MLWTLRRFLVVRNSQVLGCRETGGMCETRVGETKCVVVNVVEVEFCRGPRGWSAPDEHGGRRGSRPRGRPDEAGQRRSTALQRAWLPSRTEAGTPPASRPSAGWGSRALSSLGASFPPCRGWNLWTRLRTRSVSRDCTLWRGCATGWPPCTVWRTRSWSISAPAWCHGSSTWRTSCTCTTWQDLTSTTLPARRPCLEASGGDSGGQGRPRALRRRPSNHATARFLLKCLTSLGLWCHARVISVRSSSQV